MSGFFQQVARILPRTGRAGWLYTRRSSETSHPLVLILRVVEFQVQCSIGKEDGVPFNLT